MGAEKNSKKLDEARANIRLRIADIAARNKMIASLKAGLATEEQRRKIAESEAEEAKRAKFEAVAEADANAKATKVLEKKLAAASVRHDKVCQNLSPFLLFFLLIVCVSARVTVLWVHN